MRHLNPLRWPVNRLLPFRLMAVKTQLRTISQANAAETSSRIAVTISEAGVVGEVDAAVGSAARSKHLRTPTAR